MKKEDVKVKPATKIKLRQVKALYFAKGLNKTFDEVINDLCDLRLRGPG